MDSKFRFEVWQGDVYINVIQTLQVTDEVIWFTIDCKQKYPDVSTGKRETDEGVAYRLFIGLSAEVATTRNVNQQFTEVSIVFPNPLPGDWRMFVDTGRYSIDVVLVRVAHDATLPSWDPSHGQT